MSKAQVATVIGARPQFVKAALVSRYIGSLGEAAPFDEILIHTGQHYDVNMSDLFFEQLGMPEPQHHLSIGSASAGRQLAMMCEKLEQTFLDEKPDAVLVYGDTNSTLAAALVATQQDIPLIHVEAGERIYRRFQVPEESNRILTDHAAALCLTSSYRALTYLRREGYGPHRAKFVGDPMFDLFCWGQDQLDSVEAKQPADYGVASGGYHLATIHRVQNTSTQEGLISLLNTLDTTELPVILPVHPRVGARLKQWNWQPSGSLILTDALGYFDFMSLLLQCKRVVTDSGGVTRESFFARKPCLVPMENSWWTAIVDAGWIREVGDDRDLLARELDGMEEPLSYPEGLFGDGQSAQNIVRETAALLSQPFSAISWHRHGPIGKLPVSTASRMTYEEYRSIVTRLKDAEYEFIRFDEAAHILEQSRQFVLMRHDIDIDLDATLRMAEVEAELGIAATYFFMVRTDHYSMFSAPGTAAIQRILDLGHHLGLHMDTTAYPDLTDPEAIGEMTRCEVELMQTWFGQPVSAVSFHRPNSLVLGGSPALSAPFVHTYQEMFQRRIRYISDSRGMWRQNQDPTQIDEFAARKPLHILIHPEWWEEVPMSPYARLLDFVDKHHEDFEQSLAQNNTVYQVGRLTR